MVSQKFQLRCILWKVLFWKMKSSFLFWTVKRRNGLCFDFAGSKGIDNIKKVKNVAQVREQYIINYFKIFLLWWKENVYANKTVINQSKFVVFRTSAKSSQVLDVNIAFCAEEKRKLHRQSWETKMKTFP